MEEIILFSTHSYYFRLIHGLIASFLAFCSALGSWLMAGSSLVARRSAPVPFPGPGLALLLGSLYVPMASGHLYGAKYAIQFEWLVVVSSFFLYFGRFDNVNYSILAN